MTHRSRRNEIRQDHDLRHTWITTLAEQGVHERTAQQLAGHADGRMAREIYTRVTDTDGSSSGSNDDHEPENDEGQEPGYGT